LPKAWSEAVSANFMTNSLLSRSFSPTVLLYAFVVITQIGLGVYVVTEGDAPSGFTLASKLGFLWIVGWWMRYDSRRRGIGWVYDMGLFLYVLWPLVMAYYLVKSRGVRGLLVVLGFLVTYVGAYMFGALAAVVFIVGIQ
jgi:hypothetical protein